MIFIYLLFIALVAGLATLPLLPAIREWLHPTDTAPLRVVQESEVNVRHLAQGFRRRLSRELGSQLRQVRLSGIAAEGKHQGEPFLVVPGGARLAPTPTPGGDRCIEPLLASPGDMQLPDRTWFAREIYVEGTVSGGAEAVCRAILSLEDIRLGPGARALRWLHADGTVELAPGCRSFGRISAGQAIILGSDCHFERVNAPQVRFGDPPDPPPPAEPDLPLLRSDELRGGRLLEESHGRWLIKGDTEVPPGVCVATSLVVMGRCRVGRGSRIEGSIKTHRELILDDEVELLGSAVSARHLAVGRDCRILGPVIAEGGADFAPGVVLGAPDAPTSVCGRELTFAPGVLAHGTVWAQRRGRVGSDAEAVPVEPALAARAEVTV